MSCQLEQKWALELQKEFHHICYQYSLDLGNPIFELTDNLRMVGEYNSSLNKISMSRELFFHYPWCDILEVLKHEMAHIHAIKIYGSDHKSHGIEFQNACEQLQVEPWARKAVIDFSRVDSEEINPSIRKARKLLDLSRSSNTYESELALKRAYEIFAKFQFTDHDEYKSKQICLNKKKVDQFEYLIAHLLVSHYSVDVIFYSTYIPSEDKHVKCFDLLGRKECIDMAEYVFYYLQRTALSIWKKDRRASMNRRSYLCGIIKGFIGAIEICEKSVENHLIPTSKDPHLHRFVQKKYPRTRKTGQSQSGIDSRSYEEGKRKGEKIHISKPICKSDERRYLN